MGDILLILALTTSGCLLVGALGLVAQRLLRHRTLRLTVVLAALVPVLAVAVSVVVNVRAMFLSAHDSLVILTAVGWATVIAVIMTVMVSRLVEDGSLALRAGLRELDGATDRDPRIAIDSAPRAVQPAELASLADELAIVRQRLVDSRTRERALETSRRELVSFMSHDLRTPLTGLRALAEGLDDGMIDDVPAAMARIRSYVDRMTLLVEDLFELSRVTSGTPARPRRLVSLAELAMDVVAESEDLARDQDVKVHLELSSVPDRLAVLGDSDELARAMSNLVVNAVRHTEPGGVVRVVGGRGTDGRVRVAVVDGCGGIPAADLPFVFDAGWRGAPARTPDDGGAGFGLAIARGVAQAHAGQIVVQNVDGGCRFELALPATSS
jgi:signal transduction histidine kinase